MQTSVAVTLAALVVLVGVLILPDAPSCPVGWGSKPEASVPTTAAEGGLPAHAIGKDPRDCPHLQRQMQLKQQQQQQQQQQEQAGTEEHDGPSTGSAAGSAGPGAAALCDCFDPAHQQQAEPECKCPSATVNGPSVSA